MEARILFKNMLTCMHTHTHACTQVLANLLSNAVKFTDVGEVQIDARIVPKNMLTCMHTHTHACTQVLANLLSNAVKFTDVGEVQIDARIVPMNQLPEEALAKLSQLTMQPAAFAAETAAAAAGGQQSHGTAGVSMFVFE